MQRVLTIALLLAATGCSLLFSESASESIDAGGIGGESDAARADASVFDECGYTCESYVINRVAGNGVAGFSGDGMQATDAQLDFPAGVALDPAGNLYIADKNNDRIRMVNRANGVITTVAGGGLSTIPAGPATAYILDLPLDVAFDDSGNFYIADSASHRVFLVDGSGNISTYAGTGQPGDIDADGTATGAQLNTPSSLAVNSDGDLFIADRSNHRIRRVLGVGGTISTVAGSGTDGYSGDDGPANAAAMSFPRGIALEGLDYLYIADRGNQRIRRVELNTSTIDTVAGSGVAGFFGDFGPGTSAELNVPSGVAVDALGNLHIAEKANHRIRQVEGSSGMVRTLAGDGSQGPLGDGGDALDSQLNDPVDLVVDPQGTIYFVDQGNHVVRSLTPDTSGCSKGNCLAGNCTQDCREATCMGACAGGGCNQACASGSTCHFSCARGGCNQTCHEGASCHFSCLGGNCTQTIAPGATVLSCPNR